MRIGDAARGGAGRAVRLWGFFQDPGGFGFVIEGEVVGEGVGL